MSSSSPNNGSSCRQHSLSLGVIRSTVFGGINTINNTSNGRANTNHNNTVAVSYYDAAVEELLAAGIARALVEHYVSLGRDKYVPACYDSYDADGAAGSGEKRLVFSPTTPTAGATTTGSVDGKAKSFSNQQSPSSASKHQGPTASSSPSLFDDALTMQLLWQAHHHPKLFAAAAPSSASALRIGDEDAMRRLVDRSCRRVFGALVQMLTASGGEEGKCLLGALLLDSTDDRTDSGNAATGLSHATPAFSSKYGCEAAPSVDRIVKSLLDRDEGSGSGSSGPLSLKDAISVATAMFPENGGARQVQLSAFSSSSRGDHTVDCACTMVIVSCPIVSPLTAKGGALSVTNAAAAAAGGSAPPPPSAAVLADGHAAFICKALLEGAGEGGGEGAVSLTEEAGALAKDYEGRWKVAKHFTHLYLNNEWLAPMLQSLQAQQQNSANANGRASASSSSSSFATLRHVLGSAVHTNADGKKRKVPLRLVSDAEAELKKGNTTGDHADGADVDGGEAIGFGNGEDTLAAQQQREKGKKYGRGDANSSRNGAPPIKEGTVLTPSASPTFMAEPSGVVASNVVIVGIDAMYAYLGTDLTALEYDAIRRDEERRKKGLTADDDDDEGTGNSNKRGGRGAMKKSIDTTFYPMRAPRTLGVIGRVPLPTAAWLRANSSSSSSSSSSLFANYKTFVSKNRQNKAHMSGDAADYANAGNTDGSSVQPPAHVLWVNTSIKPRKAYELLGIKWVDGKDLFGENGGQGGVGMGVRALNAGVAYCSLLVFSWVVRGIIGGGAGLSAGLSDASPSTDSSSSAAAVEPFLVPLVEVEEAHVLDLAVGTNDAASGAAENGSTLLDVCETVENSVARLVKKEMKKHSTAATATPTTSSGSSGGVSATMIAKLEDCASVYYTDHLLGKHHPHSIWLRQQRKTHGALVALLEDRVWHEGRAIAEPKIMAAAEALGRGWWHSPSSSSSSSSPSPSPSSSSSLYLAEGPCVEYKHKVSEYSSTVSMAQVDVERLRHTIAAMGSSLGGVIIVGVRDSDGAVVGHTAGAVKGQLRASAFFPALPKDAVRVIEVKVRAAATAATTTGATTASSGAGDAAAKPSALPAGWWKTMGAGGAAGASASGGGGTSALAAAMGAAKPVVGTSTSGGGNILAALAARSASGASSSPSAAALQQKVVTIIAVEPSPSPFVLPTIRSYTRHPKVRVGGAGNGALTVGGMASRLLVFAPSEE